MGIAQPETTLKMTPGRKTRLRFDPPISVVQAPAFGLHRTGSEIARGGTDDYGTQAMHQLASGAWGLMSVQVAGAYHTERTDNFNSNMQPSDVVAASDIVFHPRNSTPALPNLTFDANAATQGNGMWIKAPRAQDNNWNASLVGAPHSIPTITPLNVPLTAVVAGNANLPPDTAHQFTFEVPGLAVNQPSALFVYHFGGPAMPDGSGLYCVIYHGDGKCVLMEATSATPGALDWIKRATWQYSEPNRTAGTHSMRIIPHRNTTGGGYIAFICNVNDKAGSLTLMTSLYQDPSDTSTFLYKLRGFKTPQTSGGTTAYRQNVTGSGRLQVSQRPDIRAWFQPSTLKYLSPGTLVDWPFCIPFATGSPPYLTISWDAVVPDGCSIVGKLYDPYTGSELSLNASTATSRTYSIVTRQPYYFAKFTLTSNAAHTATPLLWGYDVVYDGVQKTVAPGETQVLNTSATGIVRSGSFTGPEKDPTHETGQISIEDPAAVLAILDTRANIPFLFDTTYDPNDPTKRSVLGSGFLQRAEADHKGSVARQGMAGKADSSDPTGRLARPFPSPDWKHYGCITLGEWLRLQMARTLVRINLANSYETDPSDPSVMLARKVTDVVALFIAYAGYASDQIDVPDSPQRFFVGASGSADQMMVEPLTSIGDWIVKVLREYLGWFLIWDPNAGTRGMWRVRKPTVPNSAGVYTPLAHLYTGAPAGKAVHKSGTYNGKADSQSPGPYVGDGVTPVKAFIKKRSLKTWVRAMEGNAVFVTGLGDLLSGGAGQFRRSQWAFNVKSFDLPGASSADHTHPDYMPWFAPIVVFDPSQSEPEAVDFLTRRYYDQGCHAIKCARLTAPCVLVVDPSDTHQTHPRPLRYYDAIQITNKHGVTSDWLVRNCSVHFDKSAFMWMTLELEAPRETIL